MAILNYCEPAFQNVDELFAKHIKVKARKNVFFKEYEEAIKIGNFILKRFSYNISKVPTISN